MNKIHDPGFGRLSALAERPSPKLVSVDLLTLLRQLDGHSLALNVLHPFVVDSEAEVRQNLTVWVQHIHDTPDLSSEIEHRLIEVLAQLIEQKFKTLSYKELSQMLELTPLRETASVQEVLQDHTVELLTKLIKRKHRFADSTMAKLEERLHQLTLQDLEDLIEAIVDMETLREINAWISARIPRARD